MRGKGGTALDGVEDGGLVRALRRDAVADVEEVHLALLGQAGDDGGQRGLAGELGRGRAGLGGEKAHDGGVELQRGRVGGGGGAVGGAGGWQVIHVDERDLRPGSRGEQERQQEAPQGGAESAHGFKVGWSSSRMVWASLLPISAVVALTMSSALLQLRLPERAMVLLTGSS